jgi:phage terminase small subunit
MGKVTRDQIVEKLRKANRGESLSHIVMYADDLLEYRAAQANIAEHGAIVMHPRTSQPLQNPYLAVRNAASERMKRSGLNSDSLWRQADPAT